MKILIIEDEPLAAQDLRNLLSKVEPDTVILDAISSVEAAARWFATNPQPDLVLSDIQLSDGISFDIFESLHLKCPIIFTTAYDAYAIRAFKLNSIDYLLKPVDARELKAALDKFRSLAIENILGDQLKALMNGWGQQGKKFKERFLTVHRHALVPVSATDVALFHKEELIYLHTVANEKLLCEHHTLDEVESLLDPALFFRVNRQYIVHIQAVARIKTTHKGLTVQLKPPLNTEIDISREKATAFKNWMG